MGSQKIVYGIIHRGQRRLLKKNGFAEFDAVSKEYRRVILFFTFYRLVPSKRSYILKQTCRFGKICMTFWWTLGVKGLKILKYIYRKYRFFEYLGVLQIGGRNASGQVEGQKNYVRI